jgi:hypothetical protein
MSIGRAFSIFLLLWITAPAAAVCGQGLSDRFSITPDRWQQIYQKGGITVYSQKVPISDVMAFRAASLLDAPVEQVMEVLRRVEITGEWMPDIVVKYAVNEWSDFEAITFSINEMPWPISDRELLLYNRLRLDRNRKFLVVEVYSVEDKSLPVARGNVRAHMHCGETLVRPAGDGRTQVELILFVDPKGFIPAWLVNLFQKMLRYNFLKALEEKAAVSHYPLRPSYQQMLSELKSILR